MAVTDPPDCGTTATEARLLDAAPSAVIPSPRKPSDVPRTPPEHQVARHTRLLRPSSRKWVIELSMLLLLAVAYNVVRALPRGTEALAFAHGFDILAAEGPVFDAVEKPINAWMAGVPVVAVAACYFYAVMHYAATPLVFFLSRRRGGWQYWRGYWSIVIASGVALTVYALYPVAPPRLMTDLGIIDVMRSFSDYGWWGSAASAPRGIGDATNQFAAMPSMHFGWALWCSIQMWGFGSLVWRGLAVLYPSVLAVVVVGTGNHFLLDIVGGAVCVIAAYALLDLLRASAGRDSASADLEHARRYPR